MGKDTVDQPSDPPVPSFAAGFGSGVTLLPLLVVLPVMVFGLLTRLRKSSEVKKRRLRVDFHYLAGVLTGITVPGAVIAWRIWRK